MSSKEITKEQLQRDNLLMISVAEYFDKIRDDVLKIAMQETNKADGIEDYYSSYSRDKKLAKRMNTELRPNYLAKDKFVNDRTAEEYRTTYFESLYTVTNQGIKDGYLVKLPRYTKKQFKKALNDPLSKLFNLDKMKASRSVDIQQLYTTIVNGVEAGKSLPQITKDLDINLGYRDSTGKWIKSKTARKGQTYKTMRVLRTEVLRMRSVAEVDQWVNQQSIVPSKLQLLEVLDDRTRSQSAQMDGQIADENGKFLFPNGQRAYAHRSGVAKWDINDRSTTINIDPEYPPESRIQRDVKTGKNSVQPYTDFKAWAEKNNLKINRYGEVLFK